MSTKKSQAETKDKVQQAVQLLEEGIGAILDSESFKAYLDCMSRFHSYSSNNIALILAQRPDATRVAGYKRWQQLGRQVRKGEKGLMILAPILRKLEDTEGEEQLQVVSTFKVSWVFDVSQTEGEPLPQAPQTSRITEASDRGKRLWEALSAWLTSQGVSIELADLPGPLGVLYPVTKSISIEREIAGSDHAAKTLAHEAAHYVAQHCAYTDREDAETVAEASAFVILSSFGIDTSSYSFGYVAGWAQDRSVLRRNLEAIRKTAHHIIGALAPQHDEECLTRAPERAVQTF